MPNDSTRVDVTRTFLPPVEEYYEYLKRIWSSNQLTNQGGLLKEFEASIKDYLGVSNFQFVTNGTLALQIALEALDIRGGEVITTPFTYVATTSAILWQGCDPVYVDIEPDTMCIDPDKIEAAITDRTKAILPVHVYGNPCNIEAIERIAKRHGLKVIYDAAHAFGVTYKGESLFSYGDISVGSFHATKLFHTVEGGGLFTRDKELNKRIDLIKKFGHNKDDHYMLGINAKASEFQAAMGLCNLKYIPQIIKSRAEAINKYDSRIDARLRRPKPPNQTKYNNAYYPIILESEEQLEQKTKELEAINVYPRRYFYPSLNTLPYLTNRQSCPVSEDISKRILCLPLYHELEEAIIDVVCRIINK